MILRKEFKDSIKSKWLIAFAVTFFFLALGVPYLLLGGGGFLPADYPGMVVGTLVNLAVPLVPLVSLAMSSTTIAGERETGTIEYLLSQPATKLEVFGAKYVGLVISLTLAMLIGYGAAELLVYSSNPVFIVQFLFALGYSAMLSASAVALGFIVTVSVKGRAAAIGTGLFIWFIIVVIYDVGFLGVIAVILDLSDFLVPLVVANPVETTRMLAFMHMADSPLRGELGPQASFLIREYGTIVVTQMLTLVLLTWIVVPLVIAYAIFRRQDA
jgi:ABC-type transport system involved in multi-copper enzyme maturation permease subunit